MHKNNNVADISFDIANGKLVSIGDVHSQQLLPLSCQNDPTKLIPWWDQRAVSKKQSNIQDLLTKEGIPTTQSFLLNNLGLSMTDAYWVKPLDSKISWEEISFHLNPFSEDAIDFFTSRSSDHTSHLLARFTPSASSGGELKKKWIKKDGQLFLTKGNMPGFSYQQSLNEVFASGIHKKQGYENYVDYELIKFANDSIGCISKCFTSENIEFIPAWELFEKHGATNSRSLLQRYVDIAKKEGFNKQEMIDFMSYQTITDFLMTNIDRHLNNFGLLRDSNTLEPIGPAPIFDTGNSMFYLGLGITSYKDLFSINVSSLYPTEKEMMLCLSEYSLIDLTKVPTQEEVALFYKQDPAIAPYSGIIAKYYEFKRNILVELQKGRSYEQIEKAVSEFFGDNNERDKINNCWTYR